MAKNFGVSYSFKSEEAFIKHIRVICAGCVACGSIDLKKHMTEAGSDFQNRMQYMCSDCIQE
jgi:hypothetical protein